MSESAWFDPAELLEHDDFVRALVRRIVVHDDRVDDAVQETWLQALQARPRNASSLRSWLGAIARNFGKQQVRGDVRRRAREQEPRPLRPVPTPEEILEREALRRRVVEAVLELKEPYRSVILLRFFEELSNEEVADRLGIPLETARTRIKRGLDALRQRMQGRLGGDWRLMLMPLLGREVRWERTLTSSSIAGALIMSAKLKVAAGVAVAILVAGGYWLSSESQSAIDVDDIRANASDSIQSFTPPDVSASSSAHPILVTEEVLSALPPRPEEPAPIEDLAAPIETSAESGILIRVLDGEDKPVAGCEVHVGRLLQGEELDQLERLSKDHAVAVDRTESQGTTRFTLEAGRYLVAVDGPIGFSWPELAVVTDGFSETVLHLAPVASVEGRVVDEAGLPLKGARATLIAEMHRGGTIGHWDGWEVTETNTEGKFAFEGLPLVSDSRFWIRIECPAFGDAPERDLAVQGGERLDVGDIQLFERLLEVRGQVVDTSGRVIEGAELTIPEPGGSIENPSSGDLKGRSDDSGAFVIGGLKRGEKRTLSVFSKRHVRLAREIVLPDTGTALEVGRLTLEPLAHSARGHVVDVHRRPVADAEVRVSGRVTRTDENGYFEIPCEDAGPMSFDLRFDPLGEGAAIVHSRVSDIRLTEDLLELELRAKGVRFDLVDSVTGEPVRSESMVVRWIFRNRSTSSRLYRSGGTMIRVPVSMALKPGRIPFEIFPDGFEPTTVDVEIPENLDDEIVVTVPLRRK